MQWGEVDPLLDAKGLRTSLLVGSHRELLQMSPCHRLEDREVAAECQPQPFPTSATVILTEEPGQGLLGEPSMAQGPAEQWGCCQLCARWAPGGLQDSHMPPCHGNPRVISCSDILISFPTLARPQAQQASSFHTQISLSFQPQAPLSISFLQTAFFFFLCFF